MASCVSAPVLTGVNQPNAAAPMASPESAMLATMLCMAIPTSAAAKAGASLMPSPTMRVGFSRCSIATASTLSAGTRSASTASRSSCSTDRFSRIRPVARHHGDAHDARVAKRADSPAFLLQFIGKQQCACGMPVDRDEHTEGGAPGRAPQRWRRPLQPPTAINKLMRTDANFRPSTTPSSPEPMVSRTVWGILESKSLSTAAETMAAATT